MENFSNTLFEILSRDKRSSWHGKFGFISILFSYTFRNFVFIYIPDGSKVAGGKIEKENSR